MVRRHGDELRAIDYTDYFAEQFSQIANELEVAAHYSDDEALKDYLGWQAQALLQNNPDMDMLADKHWAVLQKKRRSNLRSAAKIMMTRSRLQFMTMPN